MLWPKVQAVVVVTFYSTRALQTPFDVREERSVRRTRPSTSELCWLYDWFRPLHGCGCDPGTPRTAPVTSARDRNVLRSNLAASIAANPSKPGPIDMVPSRIIEFNFLAAPASYIAPGFAGWFGDSGRSGPAAGQFRKTKGTPSAQDGVQAESSRSAARLHGYVERCVRSGSRSHMRSS